MLEMVYERNIEILFAITLKVPAMKLNRLHTPVYGHFVIHMHCIWSDKVDEKDKNHVQKQIRAGRGHARKTKYSVTWICAINWREISNLKERQFAGQIE